MAKQDIKKQLDFLRALLYEGGSLDRQAMARRLHLQPSTYDKYLREWRQRLDQAGLSGEVDEVRRGCMRLRHRRQAAERALLLAYRLTATRKQQREHLLQLLEVLARGPRTGDDLLAVLEAEHPGAFAERTLQKCLRELQAEGVVWREKQGAQAAVFGLNDWLSQLAADLGEAGRRRLRDFVDYAAATSPVSVPGYLLLDTLARYDGDADGGGERLWYRHHPVGRLLDEHWVMPLQQACAQGSCLRLDYYPKETAVRCQNHGGQSAARAQELAFWPLAVVNDALLGRWYVLGIEEAHRLEECLPEAVQVLRLENIAWLEPRPAAGELPPRWACFVQQRLQQAWLVEVREEVQEVRVRFFGPSEGYDFVEARLDLEKRWGRLEQEAPGVWHLTLPVRGLVEVRPWLRSFGARAEVLAPPALRRHFQQEWEEVRRRYGGDGEDVPAAPGT